MDFNYYFRVDKYDGTSLIPLVYAVKQHFKFKSQPQSQSQKPNMVYELIKLRASIFASIKSQDGKIYDVYDELPNVFGIS